MSKCIAVRLGGYFKCGGKARGLVLEFQQMDVRQSDIGLKVFIPYGGMILLQALLFNKHLGGFDFLTNHQ